MRQRHLLLITLMLLVCAGLLACGTTGKTSPFVLTLDLPKGQKAVSDIRIASTAMDPDAAILNVVNVQPWGKFELDDLRNIEGSLRDTITPQLPETIRSTGPRLDVHMVVRRYMVSVSNTGGAVLVIVAWAATDSKGKLIYDEQFYASEETFLVGTIGLLKDSVHKAIVRRIATTSLSLAAGAAVAEVRPTNFDNTFTSLEEATSRLPQTMVSMGIPAAVAIRVPVVSVVGILTPSGVSTVQWKVAKPSQDFDWQGYLEKLYKTK